MSSLRSAATDQPLPSERRRFCSIRYGLSQLAFSFLPIDFFAEVSKLGNHRKDIRIFFGIQ